MNAFIRHIEYYLPETLLANEELATQFEGWTAEKIEAKTGIRQRAIAGPNLCASDLAVKAAEKIFASGCIQRADIDFLILCTQSPDYPLPTSACVIQHRLGLLQSCGAFDINLGCSGYIYLLGLAKGLIQTGQARHVLLLTAETYSKFIHPKDKSVRTIFGDGAAATLVSGTDSEGSDLGPFVYGTDGSGAENLMVATGGTRQAIVPQAPELTDESGNVRTINHLVMNGPKIFEFTLRVAPESFTRLMCQAGITPEQVDLFVFHQANQFMLDHLRRKLNIPSEKFVLAMSHCGNTVSSTIPIALKEAQAAGKLKPGMTVLLLGFGVGYSWGGTLIKWR